MANSAISDWLDRLLLWFNPWMCSRDFHRHPASLSATTPCPADFRTWHPNWRGRCFACGVEVESSTWYGRRVWRRATHPIPDTPTNG